MNPAYDRVAERADHRCEYCRAPEVIFNLRFEVEHILPRSKGGPDDEDNLALACRSCNQFKSDCTDGFDLTSGTRIRLHHPRRDAWPDNFRLDSASGRIIGLTPVGYATIERLQLNGTLQVAARSMWIELGLFGSFELGAGT